MSWRLEPQAGGVSAPLGFRAAGRSCGLKPTGAPDLALLVSDPEATAAAIFTTNLVQAAPVVLAREALSRSQGRVRGIVVNSGCANACTGVQGMAAARETARRLAELLSCSPDHVLVGSTGVIGVQLDVDKVVGGLQPALVALSPDGGSQAARAIMTTDTRPKEHAVQVQTASGNFRIGGMAKGSGMIEPMMATMLAYLTSDATVARPLLQQLLAEVAADTFNAITVDGECSTNDSCVLLANGASGVTVDGEDSETSRAFRDGLRTVCGHLALEIVRDGEGATKLVRVRVTGAQTRDEARRAARVIANSPLVKTACHGGDPNWGRLVAAAGRAGVRFDLDHARVAIGGVVLFEAGQPFDEAAPEAAEHLREREISIVLDLGAGGSQEATMWTCDLSADYVRINADYRT